MWWSFGGDYARNGANPAILTFLPPQVCLSPACSTLNGVPAMGQKSWHFFRCRPGFSYSRAARSNLPAESTLLTAC